MFFKYIIAVSILWPAVFFKIRAPVTRSENTTCQLCCSAHGYSTFLLCAVVLLTKQQVYFKAPRQIHVVSNLVPFSFFLTRIRMICYKRAKLNQYALALQIPACIFSVSEPRSCFFVAKNYQEFSANLKSQLGAKVQ